MATLTEQNARSVRATEMTSASAYLREILRSYGLESMLPWVRQELMKGYDDVVVVQNLREQPQFRERFRAIFDREAAGLPAMSPAEVIAYEQQALDLMQKAGFPRGFYDDPATDFADLMAKNISLDELSTRVEAGFKRVANAPQQVKDAFRDFFGAEAHSAMASFFLDPDKALPLLETEVQAAVLGGTGRRYGVGVGKDVAMELARQGLSDKDAEGGFGTLTDQIGLFNENLDEIEDLAVDKEGVEAVFNMNQESRKKVESRGKARVAAFQGSGGASQSQTGASGLGVAGKP